MIHVVAGAVTDAAGRVLIAQRPPGKHLAGGWEFPGGKLEPGESRAAGLARELHEELGIAIREPRPLLRLRHSYSIGEVLIDMWVVARYGGVPQGLDGQALKWCAPDELVRADLLPADVPIVRALRLPECLVQDRSPYYAINDPMDADGPGYPEALRGVWCASVEQAGAIGRSGGAEFLVMRSPVPDDALRRLCESVPLPVYARDLELEMAWRLGATGICDIGD